MLGQALSAAQHTVEDRVAHSLHAYFLRPRRYGSANYLRGGPRKGRRQLFDATRRGHFSTAGRSSTSRHHSRSRSRGSITRPEAPDVPGPDDLKDLADLVGDMVERLPLKMRRFMTDKRPFEFRPVEPLTLASAEPRRAVKHVWIRAVDALPDELALHQNLLAYVSDFELLGTATLPHGMSFIEGKVMLASLDHGLWFHRDFRIDEWLLYAMESPNASGARGFARGQLFDASGTLVASTAQEGLMRHRRRARANTN